jgi:hypothetical protein
MIIWLCNKNGTYPTTLTHTLCLLCSQDKHWYTTNWQWTVKLIESRRKAKTVRKFTSNLIKKTLKEEYSININWHPSLRNKVSDIWLCNSKSKSDRCDHRLSINRPTKREKEKSPSDGQCEKEVDDHLLACQHIL